MKRAELQAGQVLAHVRYGVAVPVVVLDTEPWQAIGYGPNRCRRASGGSGVAVAHQSGWDYIDAPGGRVSLPKIQPEVVRLQQLTHTWEQELEYRAAQDKAKDDYNRKAEDDRVLIENLPDNLDAGQVLSRIGTGEDYYRRKTNRVEVDLRALVELVLSFHQLSYQNK